jgi:hypothetical protein
VTAKKNIQACRIIHRTCPPWHACIHAGAAHVASMQQATRQRRPAPPASLPVCPSGAGHSPAPEQPSAGSDAVSRIYRHAANNNTPECTVTDLSDIYPAKTRHAPTSNASKANAHATHAPSNQTTASPARQPTCMSLRCRSQSSARATKCRQLCSHPDICATRKQHPKPHCD